MPPSSLDAGPLAVLKRVRSPRYKAAPGEVCDICSSPIASEHGHVVELDSRALKCCCQACALLFTNEGAGGGRWRRVPREAYCLGPSVMTPELWDSLQIPVGVAFLLRSSDTCETSVFYPSPAGATESLLPLGALAELSAAEPLVSSVKADVEAILVRFDRGAVSCYIVPVDVCYELVGLLRQSWRGFDGGKEAHERLDGFFTALQGRAKSPAARATTPPSVLGRSGDG